MYCFVFLEKPSKPIGPLKTYDIEKTSISISWKAPEDDGGSPLTGYIIEKKEANRQYWNNVAKVAPSVTNYRVEDLRQSCEYDFRVTAINKIGLSDPLETDASTMAKSSFSKL